MNTLFAQTLESGDLYMEEKERKGKERREVLVHQAIHIF